MLLELEASGLPMLPKGPRPREEYMSEVTIFALALLAVPVFARFARESGKKNRSIYHLFGLGGLFLLLGEITRIVSDKILFMGKMLPIIDPVTAILGYLSVVVGTLWIAYESLRHMREVGT